MALQTNAYYICSYFESDSTLHIQMLCNPTYILWPRVLARPVEWPVGWWTASLLVSPFIWTYFLPMSSVLLCTLYEDRPVKSFRLASYWQNMTLTIWHWQNSFVLYISRSALWIYTGINAEISRFIECCSGGLMVCSQTSKTANCYSLFDPWRSF
jgi:hypothetical protein